MLEALGADAGGWSRMTIREQLTAEIAVDAVLICRVIVNHAFSAGLLLDGQDGPRLTPAVAKGLATYMGTATRAFAALGLRPDRVEHLQNLGEYLRTRAAAGGNGHTSATPAPPARSNDATVSRSSPGPLDAAEAPGCREEAPALPTRRN